MGMVLAIIGIVLFLILLVIAVAIGINREKTEKEEQKPIIHASGIYSVVRKSPREECLRQKPTEQEIRKYISGTNVDINGKPLTEQDKENAISDFFIKADKNIGEIEEGDKAGVEFYYYEYISEDPVCVKYISKGQYVTREDLFKFAKLVPPFHLGCSCTIKRHRGGDKLKDTTELGLRPLLSESAPVPTLPNWHTILKA
jgi:hypothetical protein